ncbi:12955_t:CDS:2, partial [Entrophospora sp. SA101]
MIVIACAFCALKHGIESLRHYYDKLEQVNIDNLDQPKSDDKRNSDDFGDNANDDGVSIKRQNKKFSKLRKIFNIRKSKK